MVIGRKHIGQLKENTLDGQEYFCCVVVFLRSKEQWNKSRRFFTPVQMTVMNVHWEELARNGL